MGVQKISSKVAKKSTKLETLHDFVFENPNGSTRVLDGPTVKAGPSHKKAHSTGKTQAPKVSGKSKGSSTTGHSAKSSTHHATKSHTKSKGSHSGKKNGLGLNGRGGLDSLGMGETVCREVACEGLATSGGYCRLHYIKNWKKIKRKELILREKKLNQYIEELVAKYPDKYIEAIRQDLANDKDFAKVIYDLDLDEGVDDFDIEGSESADSLIDTIKRDFDDEGEVF